MTAFTPHDPFHLGKLDPEVREEIREEARGLARDTVGGAVTFALLLAMMWAMASLNGGWLYGVL